LNLDTHKKAAVGRSGSDFEGATTGGGQRHEDTAGDRRNKSVVEIANGEIVSIPALVPPGLYEVRMTHWFTRMLFGRRGKLGLCFRVCGLGEHHGVELVRWYNVRPRGTLGRSGAFQAGWGSHLLREYITLVGAAKRNDRIALTKYSKLVLIAEVKTVTSDREQNDLPAGLHYSVISKLVRVEAGHAR
jgi:hypothetical protein